MRELKEQSMGFHYKTIISFKQSRISSSNIRHLSLKIQSLPGKKNTSKIAFIISTLLISFLAFAITNAAVTSSQTIHMTGSIAYPSPTPTPTPMPTITPNSDNLAPLSLYRDGGTWGYGPYEQSISMVTWQGQKAIKLLDFGSPYTGQNGMADREIDTATINVNPNDVITLSAWFWTEPSTIGDTSSLHGAELELDFLNGITVNNANGIGVPMRGSGTTVPWGSNAWVYQTMTFTVPSSWQPTGLIVPITIYSSNPGAEGAAVYIYGTELYIN